MSITRHKIAGKNVTVLLHSTVGEPQESMLQYIAKQIVEGHCQAGELIEGQWYVEDAEEIDWQAIATKAMTVISDSTSNSVEIADMRIEVTNEFNNALNSPIV